MHFELALFFPIVLCVLFDGSSAADNGSTCFTYKLTDICQNDNETRGPCTYKSTGELCYIQPASQFRAFEHHQIKKRNLASQTHQGMVKGALKHLLEQRRKQI